MQQQHHYAHKSVKGKSPLSSPSSDSNNVIELKTTLKETNSKCEQYLTRITELQELLAEEESKLLSCISLKNKIENMLLQKS